MVTVASGFIEQVNVYSS